MLAHNWKMGERPKRVWPSHFWRVHFQTNNTSEVHHGLRTASSSWVCNNFLTAHETINPWLTTKLRNPLWPKCGGKTRGGRTTVAWVQCLYKDVTEGRILSPKTPDRKSRPNYFARPSLELFRILRYTKNSNGPRSTSALAFSSCTNNYNVHSIKLGSSTCKEVSFPITDI